MAKINGGFPLKIEYPIPNIPKLNINVEAMLDASIKTQAVVDKSAHDLKIRSYKVIYNPPATILITHDAKTHDEKKYVSKVHNEEFDEEKGLLMCLAKANGITHLDLKKIMKNAHRPKKKEQV